MRVIIHAGTHKTGTTSIQKILFDNRDWLAERGIIYPWGGVYDGIKTPHHRFSHDLTGVNPAHLDRARAFIDQTFSQAEKAHTIIISAEPVYRHIDNFDGWTGYSQFPDFWARRNTYLARLASAFHGENPEIFLYFRNRAEFVRSFTAQAIKKKYWQGDTSDFERDFAPMLDYERQIHCFKAHFSKVTVRDYDTTAHNIIPAFFQDTGLPLPPGDMNVRVNVTPA